MLFKRKKNKIKNKPILYSVPQDDIEYLQSKTRYFIDHLIIIEYLRLMFFPHTLRPEYGIPTNISLDKACEIFNNEFNISKHSIIETFDFLENFNFLDKKENIYYTNERTEDKMMDYISSYPL